MSDTWSQITSAITLILCCKISNFLGIVIIYIISRILYKYYTNYQQSLLRRKQMVTRENTVKRRKFWSASTSNPANVRNYSDGFRVHDLNELFFLFVYSLRYYTSIFRFWFRNAGTSVGNFRAHIGDVRVFIIIQRIPWPLSRIIFFLSSVILDTAFVLLNFPRTRDRDLCLKHLDIHWKFLDTCIYEWFSIVCYFSVGLPFRSRITPLQSHFCRTFLMKILEILF